MSFSDIPHWLYKKARRLVLRSCFNIFGWLRVKDIDVLLAV